MEEIAQIKKFARENAVPIIQDEGIDFILEYIRTHNVKSVLEIGTAIGYSTIKFAQVRDDIFVSTIEYDLERYTQAVKNVHDNDLMDRITLYLGDALTYDFTDKFDVIFIDGAKAQYTKFFEHFKKNLTEDGVFICDNLSFHGMVEDLSLTHNDSTIRMVKKLRRFIDFLKSNLEFETTFYTLGDGMAVSRRKPSCQWCRNNDFLQHFHDEQWGNKTEEDNLLFEYLILFSIKGPLPLEFLLEHKEEISGALMHLNLKHLCNISTVEQITCQNGLCSISNEFSKEQVQEVCQNACAYNKILSDGKTFSGFLWSFTGGKQLLADSSEAGKILPEIEKALAEQGFVKISGNVLKEYLLTVGVLNGHSESCWKYSLT